ncbi:MAG: hypothetical protein ACRCXZ_08785, partial [Patescibacteria group bacterium]
MKESRKDSIETKRNKIKELVLKNIKLVQTEAKSLKACTSLSEALPRINALIEENPELSRYQDMLSKYFEYYFYSQSLTKQVIENFQDPSNPSDGRRMAEVILGVEFQGKIPYFIEDHVICFEMSSEQIVDYDLRRGFIAQSEAEAEMKKVNEGNTSSHYPRSFDVKSESGEVTKYPFSTIVINQSIRSNPLLGQKAVDDILKHEISHKDQYFMLCALNTQGPSMNQVKEQITELTNSSEEEDEILSNFQTL